MGRPERPRLWQPPQVVNEAQDSVDDGQSVRRTRAGSATMVTTLLVRMVGASVIRILAGLAGFRRFLRASGSAAA